MMYEQIDAKKKSVKDKIPVAKRSAGAIAKHGGPGAKLHNPKAFNKMSKGQWSKLGGSQYEALKKVGGGKRAK